MLFREQLQAGVNNFRHGRRQSRRFEGQDVERAFRRIVAQSSLDHVVPDLGRRFPCRPHIRVLVELCLPAHCDADQMAGADNYRQPVTEFNGNLFGDVLFNRRLDGQCRRELFQFMHRGFEIV